MDILLQKFFEIERWEEAIAVGVDKGIDKKEMRQLCTPEVRQAMCDCIMSGDYEIAPPHQAKIPKDNGDFRIVYINENIDRIFLSIVNNLLFELLPDMIHPSCKSYQSGIGCGKVVQQASRRIDQERGKVIGWKSDLSKYFDSVPIQCIDGVFNEIERRIGKSKIFDVVRKYYHSDLCFDIEGNLIEHYQSLKQGCAVASFLADVMLYDIDKELSEMNGVYVRYSDDCLFVGRDYEKAMEIMVGKLDKMNMKLNPKKVEYLSSERWFKFLGFCIKGNQISLSKSRIKSFQMEIEKRTIKKKSTTFKNALNSVQSFLYKGDGTYSWATSVLPIINVSQDINTLNGFVMDALRAVKTGKKKIGGLGCVYDLSDKTVLRGTGKNVKANKEKMPKIEGYYSLNCMRTALLLSRNLYGTLARNM